jgi:general secretion pathway protein D
MKKNVYVTPLLVITIVLSSTLSSEVYAQFDKYKSKTKFKSSKTTPPPAATDIVIPDTGKSAKDLLEAKDNRDTSNFADEDNGDSGNEDSNSSMTVDSGNSPERSPKRDTFGRMAPKQTKPTKVDKKYVDLNPETAFGPEVVVSFDFPNVSILDLTKHMQKLTGLNLILDKDIKGKISISTPSPITIGDAWKAYLQALSINGYSLVKTGAYYTIVNNRDIRYSPTTMYTGTYSPNTENYVMQIIPLKYVNSREVANSFRPFMSRYGRIIEIKQTNTVIVQETGTHINRLMKLIKFIDTFL